MDYGTVRGDEVDRKDIDRSLRIMNMLDVVVDYGTVHGDEAVRKDIN